VVQFKAALDLQADFAPALAQLGALALTNRDFPAAENYYRRLLQIDPRACTAHLDLGVSARAQSHPDAALTEFQSAVRCDPTLTLAYYEIGSVLHRHKKDCAGALTNYRKYISGALRPLPATDPVFAALQECEQQEATAALHRSPTGLEEPAHGAKPAAVPSEPPAAHQK
jgi:tetratricopeptide (TPR) repeat protein